MDTSADTRAPDALALAHANANHGIVTRHELEWFGLTDVQIAGRVRSGRITRLHPGVYCVGHRALTVSGRRLAAVLACGPDAVLSHQTAADAWELRPTSSPVIHVSVPSTFGRGGPDAVRLHRLITLLDDDVTVLDAVPITTPMRTLFDLAAVVRPHALRKAAMQSVHRQLFDLGQLETLLEFHPRRQGTRSLRAVLVHLRDTEPITRSELERRFARICRSAGVEPPAQNVGVAGYEIDAAWPRQRLAVELDGRRWHEARLAMAADRAKDRRLTIAGWRPVRFTWTDVVHDRAGVVADLRSLLATRVG